MIPSDDDSIITADSELSRDSPARDYAISQQLADIYLVRR